MEAGWPWQGDGRTLRHPVAGGILTAIGAASLLLALMHLADGHEPPSGLLLGVVPPALLSIVVVLAGLWLATSSIERGAALRVLGWAVAGAVVAGGTTATFVLYQAVHGVAVSDAAYAIAAAGDGGLVTGLLVATYDYRARRETVALEATSRMLDTVRQVTQAAERADSRDALEADVCTHIAASEPYISAWIGEVDGGGQEVIPRTMPAEAEPYLEAATIPVETASDTPAASTAARQSGEVRVVEDVHSHPSYEEWRDVFTEYGIVSTLATPLEYDGHHYGVLTVYADRPDAFRGRERRIFDELGETVAHALRAIESRDRLERHNDKLEALNQLLRHDIRNDMTVIMAHGERLREGDEIDEESLALMLEKVDHVVELTETAREISETMREAEDDLEAIRLDVILRQVIEDVRGTYPAASLTVDGDLPTITVRANEMLSSVFENLLNNAVQHHDRDDPQVTVTLDAGEDAVKVAVADDGPGIPDAMKERVFEHGEAGPGSSGTGLGLYLVDRLVAHYHGEVTVADNEPRGTVFRVALPRA